MAIRGSDALAFETLPFFEERQAAWGSTHSGVVLSFGYLGEQTTAQTDFGEGRCILDTNLVAAVSILNVAANRFERGQAISCAPPPGRQSNSIYGAVEAGLSVYLQACVIGSSAQGS